MIGQAWELYKGHWRHLLSIALVVYLLIALLTILLVLLLGGVGVVLGVFVSLAGVFWIQGALVIAIEDVRDGRVDLSVRETLARMRTRINTLSLAALTVFIILVVAAFIIFFGLLLFVVPGAVLLGFFIWGAVRWILMIPVIMLEGRGVFGALDRSVDLVRGNWWPMFGVVLVTILIQAGVGTAVSAVLYSLPDWGQAFGQIVSGTLTAPFTALAWTLSYYELRGLKEVAPAPAV